MSLFVSGVGVIGASDCERKPRDEVRGAELDSAVAMTRTMLSWILALALQGVACTQGPVPDSWLHKRNNYCSGSGTRRRHDGAGL